MKCYNSIKENVLNQIVGNKSFQKLARPSKWRAIGFVFHMRFVANPKQDGTYAFDINPNMLSADFAVWICGTAERFYVIPNSVIRDIYGDPRSYQSRHHPTHLAVVSVNPRNHQAIYGTGKTGMNFSDYLQERISNEQHDEKKNKLTSVGRSSLAA